MASLTDPADMAWLRESDLEVAGCITVVTGADETTAMAAFGCAEELDLDRRWSVSGDEAVISGQAAHVLAVPGGIVLAQSNGDLGVRSEVLGPASRGRGRKAASIFWNVDSMVVVALARGGRLLCCAELDDLALRLVEDGEEPDGLPAALLPLVRAAADEDADLVAIGAAIVATFTGVGLDPETLVGGRTFLTRAPEPEPEATAAEHSPLLHSEDRLHRMIVDLPPETQRALAHLVAEASADSAGIADSPPVAASIASFDRDDPGPDPGLARKAEEWRRSFEAASSRDLLIDDAPGRVATAHAAARRWAGEALRYAFHPDPLTAATHCVRAALFVFGASITERQIRLVEDEAGRHAEFPEGPHGHEPELRAVLDRVLVSDPSAWPAIRADLPTPLTESRRSEAAQRDAEREEQGDFDTWVVVETASPTSFDSSGDEETLGSWST